MDAPRKKHIGDEIVCLTSGNVPNGACLDHIKIGGEPIGRLVFRLFADKAPKAAENFRVLCTGEKVSEVTAWSGEPCLGLSKEMFVDLRLPCAACEVCSRVCWRRTGRGINLSTKHGLLLPGV